MSTTGVKLDDKTQTRLKKLGKLRDRSPHWLMRKAIDEYLEREEKYERQRAEDLARWEHYVLTGEAVDHEKVEPWLNELAAGKFTPWQK